MSTAPLSVEMRDLMATLAGEFAEAAGRPPSVTELAEVMDLPRGVVWFELNQAAKAGDLQWRSRPCRLALVRTVAR